MNHTMPNTGIPSPILLGIFAVFITLWVAAAWRDRHRNEKDSPR